MWRILRKRLEYLLKHNVLMQVIYRVCAGFLFRAITAVISVDEQMILFSSFGGKSLNDSPKVIFDYISKCEKYGQYKCIWALEDPQRYPDIETVKIDTPRYFYLAMKAKYWCTNTNIERGLVFKKKEQVYLNTWHGIALKYIGNDCPGRKDCSFQSVDYLVVSGEHDEMVFRSAFSARESMYLRCGLPRNEELWEASNEKRARIRKLLSISDEKQVILYAPTWRDYDDCGVSCVFKCPIDFHRWREELGDQYIILFRAHHQTTEVQGIAFNQFVRNMTSYPFVNELMIAADVLVTDYSSIAFDFSVLCKPIYCYAHDYDQYQKNRGMYLSINDVYPNPICKNELELLWKIKNRNEDLEAEKTRRFRNMFIQYGTGAAELCVMKLLEK